jgi:general secretion pathway protein A
MYNTFFGFREKPFKLVPNPDYLYLSKSHEDALAHLTYALDQGDGFVVISGEVGTGKTTLCRNFLEQLDTHTESAYIFNPRLDSTQLMSSICNEYGIKTSGNHDVKELLDKLNTYLIAQHSMDRKVVLLIDEAQGLSVKSLEMVRLVSNLETTRSKLLQIILVGQPELEDKLASHELRQLAQRISLNCQLEPLTALETEGYIRHRVSVAAVRPVEIFSANAARRAFEYAAGVPRLINIACDRALLAAYSQNQPKVNEAIMQTVIAELDRRGPETKPRKIPVRLVWPSILIIFLLAASYWWYQSNALTKLFSRTDPRKPAQTVSKMVPQARTYKVPSYSAQTETAPPTKETKKTASPRVATESRDDLSLELTHILADMDRHTSRQRALSFLFGMWQKPQPISEQMPSTMPDEEFFRIAARQNGMRSFPVNGDWDLVKRINLPAIVGLKQAQTGHTIYLPLIGWTNRQVRLASDKPDSIIVIEIDGLRDFLEGSAYILWRNILGYDAIISGGANPDSILKVKELLVQIGYNDVAPTPIYDLPMRESILDFQVRHQLKADGLVGPLTKILLIREAGTIDVPLLNQGRGDGA